MAMGSSVMRATTMPAMMLPCTRRRNSRNEQDRNNRKQRQLEDVFHVKSPDS